MTDLSGRVSLLEDITVYLQQDILLRPDNTTFSSLIKNWNTQFNSVDTKYTELNRDVQELQVLYVNLLTGGYRYSTSGDYGTDLPPGLSGMFLQETFETISKNLKQYPYQIYYDLSGQLSSVVYNIAEDTDIIKSLEYDSSGQLTFVRLSGVPNPEITLTKKLIYSGENLASAEYY